MPIGRTFRSRELGNRRLLDAHVPGTHGKLSDDIRPSPPLVDVPASFAGQRVLWHFDGVYNGAEVFVNGQRGRLPRKRFTPLNVTSPRPQTGQRNLMAVRGIQDDLDQQP